MGDSTRREQLRRISTSVKNGDITETVRHDVVDILSDPTPCWRDILIGILLDHPDTAYNLLHTVNTAGKHQLNVVNLMILVCAYTKRYYANLVDVGEKLDKKTHVGTTLFDAILTELEEPNPDMESFTEGMLINSRFLAQENGI